MRDSALDEVRVHNDSVLAHLSGFSASTPAHAVQPPRIAQLRTQPSANRTSAPSRDARSDQPRRSVRAFTRVFDQPLRGTSTEGAPVGSVAVKDMIAVRGHANTCGCAAFRVPTAEVTAEVVQRLLAANWSCVGMTNMHAMAYGTTGLVSEIGPAVNALDPRVVPGGSSSGSAVAVAAGDVTVALGTDTGGSIRIPAALNGVVGFKPTHGRVPVDGVVPLAPTLDHVGPIGRTVADTAAAFAAMDGTDGSSPLLVTEPADLRIGVPRRHFLDELDTTTRASFERLVHTLDGLDITDSDIDHTDYLPAAQLALLTREAALAHPDLVLEHGDELPEELRLRFEAGRFIDDDAVAAGRVFRREWIAAVDRRLEEFDVLMTPTVGVSEPRVDEPTCRTENSEFPTGRILQRLTSPFNLSGHPVISIPFWEEHRAIPLGVQLISAKGHDHLLLAVAAHLESRLPGRSRTG